MCVLVQSDKWTDRQTGTNSPCTDIQMDGGAPAILVQTDRWADIREGASYPRTDGQVDG